MKKLLMLVLVAVIVTGLSFAGSLTVNSPNGGEVWKRGVSKTISWNGSGLTNPVKITLWKNGVIVGLIVKDQPANGTYSWTVGSYTGGTADCAADYKIKVREQGGAAFLTEDSSNANFEIECGSSVPDWGWLKDKLRRYRDIRWKIPGPWPGPGPVCLSCPPDFNFAKIRELIKEMGLKEQVTVEIVKGGEVFGKAVIGENGKGFKGMRRMKTMPKLRMAKLRKFSEAKGKTLRKGVGFKLVIKNSMGKVIAENDIKLKEMAAKR